jgi:diaminohydroxyphosphoribosylaminopyrimidine deaminase/5-amino-6-(5-phosphoribosylamino)uracil reductase
MAFKNLPPGTSLEGVTAYVTLEPCSHFGFQPPCVELFLNSGIQRIVIAAQDPDARVNGRGIERLRSHGIQVEVGILENEAKAFLFPFFFQAVSRKPAWIAKWAQTPNGFLADDNGHSKWITNEKSRAYTHWLRQKYDVIVIGAETYLKDLPKLTSRDSAPPHHRSPIPVIFDPKAKLSPHTLPSHFVHWTSEGQNPQTPAELILNFKNFVDAYPFDKPLQSVMVEGGAALLNLLLDQDLIDAIHQFVGTKEFDAIQGRHRIQWNPKGKWTQVARYYFDQDCLHEWWKGF